MRDEVEAYLADLELTRRPSRAVQSKCKYLGDFVRLIGKKFADECRREDVLPPTAASRAEQRAVGKTISCSVLAIYWQEDSLLGGFPSKLRRLSANGAG